MAGRVSLGKLVATIAVAIALLPALASAAATPSPNDPCAAAGRDTCGTTGVGRYATYQFGLRWFGDYRNAVPGVSAAMFCVDLNFWYPGKQYAYKRLSAAGLRTRAGTPVPDANLHRMAYALWKYGRTSNPDQQGAVMMYIHGEMGDGAQVPPNAIGGTVNGIYDQIAAASAKYAGPYTLQVRLPSSTLAGDATTLTAAVVSASGASVPGVAFKLHVTGATGAPSKLTSGSSGTAQATISPKDLKHGVHVTATATGLPSNLPVLYVPTKGKAAANGQRLVTGASQSLSGRASASVKLSQPKITTTATPATLDLGASSADKVTITGAPGGFKATVQVALYGPAASAAAVSCSGTPAASTSYTAGGGNSKTPALRPPAVGYYAYQLTIPATATTAAVTTGCGEASETLEVQTQPQVHTQVSSGSLQPGGTLSDTVDVSGLGGQQATITANLYGPYPAPNKITCQGAPYWTGTIAANGDGTYTTATVPLTVAGYYVYRESIAPSGFVLGATTSCSDTAESTILAGQPSVQTQVSDATTAPGSRLSDTAVVTGLGALTATVNVQLYGPFATQSAISCGGTPVWTGSFTASGDGTYKTAAVTLRAAGYYIYHEAIAPTTAYAAADTGCSAASETTFAHATPTLGTTVSNAVVRPGSSISDRIKVSGLGSTAAVIGVQLFGPFASVDAISCGGRPAWRGSVKDTSGDGTVTSPAVRIPRAGFYVFRERLVGSRLVAGVTTPCSVTAETSLGAPAIITGGGGPIYHGRAAAAGRPSSSVPTRVQIPSLGIDAPIQPADIDLAQGELGVPSNIHRTAWWKDGAVPSDSSGTVLLAGHVDSAAAGAGAFFPLKTSAVHAGQTVVVTTADGKQYRYRITRVQTMPKPKLPTGIFTQSGQRKLVLVTCGGPFDPHTHHYLDNVVVTAVPA